MLEADMKLLLSHRFPEAKRDKPYTDDTEYRESLLSLLSFALVSAVTFKQKVAELAWEENLPQTAMTTAEALDFLAEYPQAGMGAAENFASAGKACADYIRHRLLRTEQADIPLRLEWARRACELDEFSFFCMVCALSCDLNRGFEQLFAALHGQMDLPRPTLGAAMAAYSLLHTAEPDEACSISNPSSPANRLVFAYDGNYPFLHRPLSLRPAMLAYLLGQPYLSRVLGGRSTCFYPGASSPRPLFIEEQLHTAHTALLAVASRRDPPLLAVLCGPKGCGKKLTLQYLANRGDARILLVDIGDMEELDAVDQFAGELLSAVLFGGYLLAFSYDGEDLPPNRFRRLMSMLAAHRVGGFLLMQRMRSNIVLESHLVMRMDYPMPSLPQALSFWKELSGEYRLAPDIDWAQFAARYRLTPGQIRGALQSADTVAQLDEGPIGPALLDKMILQGNSTRLGEIADPVPVFYNWDDLVLGENSRQLLRSVCNRIRYKHQVEDVWEFGGKSAYGKGVSILLFGPPGTGKTMSAQVIAGELNLPLYRIDLAQIVSKYIGETAKNLDKVFAEAKSSNVILFFDEADSLFSKRTEVKNSNDRHANSESAYLLQKIEEYSGISILATNFANNLDEAFRRRISYIINIHMPSAQQRLALWRQAFPERAPLAGDIDFALLADNLEVSGSVIKSAAVQAAYFAADLREDIAMRHIVRAMRLELEKLGKPEPQFMRLYS